MDFQQIQELIKLLSESSIGEFKLEQEDIKLSIRTKHYFDAALLAKATAQPVSFAPPPPALHLPPPVTPAVQSAVPAANTAVAKPAAGNETETSGKTITIKSPMIGTFYRSSSPDKPPYAKIGDEISPGKVLCIIEAMKLFNEIESELSGRIVKILVEDAAPVEYDQPLFLVEPI
ncbi:acetyl-CoA carboxylase biotin carboxyl carrier protein [Sphingobacteriales bacterium UPWRP_1]|nr:acetyl-CoA carboxylase, biotin carboxyl carrier protein [Sphingobacteriales bacterium TSM_CSM]PSJ74185.1 acetyl-CoA carboxylase biotin carboxyl carrier protein [Sphingobacteriales bacterium UPWRP_1]